MTLYIHVLYYRIHSQFGLMQSENVSKDYIRCAAIVVALKSHIALPQGVPDWPSTLHIIR